MAKRHLLPPPSTGNRRREGRSPAAPGRRPWATVADGRRGKRGRAAQGTDSPPPFPRRGAAGVTPLQRAATGGLRVRRRHCGAQQWPGLGGNGAESDGNPSPTSVRAGAQRGGGVTRAGGGGHGGSGWRRSKAGEEGHGGGVARGGGCGARGPLYSRGKAVGRAERVGWPAGQLAAINGVRSGASGEAGLDVSGSGVQRRGGASGEAATR